MYQKQKSERQRNLNTVIDFYSEVIKKGPAKARFEEEVAEVTRDYQRRMYFRTNQYKTEEGLKKRMELITAKIRDKFGPILSKVYYVKVGSGYRVQLDFVSFDTIIERKLQDIYRWDDDALASEALRIKQEAALNEMYYINKKKYPNPKEQIMKKNPYTFEQEIEEALEFLDNLENDPELNRFVDDAIRWLKNGTISLPRDAEMVMGYFKKAREFGIDTQKAKSPFDIIKAIWDKEKTKVTEGETLDYNNIPELHFVRRATTADGKVVDIYNVDNTEEGQRAVVNIIAKTSPKLPTGKPLLESSWCLSHYNWSATTLEATPSIGAKNMWFKRYNTVQKQIAVYNGIPVAFNASALHRDQWWDLEDVSYSSIEGISTRIYDAKVQRGKANRTSYIFKLGSFEYYGHDDYLEVSSKYERKGKTTTRYVITNGLNVLSKGFSITNDHYNQAIDFRTDRLLIDIDAYTYLVIEKDKELYESIPEHVTEYVTELNIAGSSFKINLSEEDLHKVVSYYNTLNKLSDDLYSKVPASLFDDIISFAETIATPKIKEEKEKREEEERKRKEQAEQRRLEREAKRGPEFNWDNHDTVETAVAANRINETIPNEYATEQENDNEYAEEIEQDDLIALGTTINEYNEYEEEVEPSTIVETMRAFKEGKIEQMYNERVKQPLNKELSGILHGILKKYHFEVIEGPIQEVFGEDTLGALDIIQKIVYLALEKDRNAITDAEEFSHAFIELMGSAYRKNLDKYPEAKTYSTLRDMVEKTSLYQQTFEDYKTVYTYNNGKPDIPTIKKEALGKALAAVLTDRYEVKTEADKSFFATLKKWFNDILLYFKSHFASDKDKRNEFELQRQLNKIADSILNGTYAAKYLNKMKDASNLRLVDFRGTLEAQTRKDGGRALNIIQTVNQTGAILTGSLAYRAQGTVYRKEQDTLHDLDFVVNTDSHSLFSDHPSLKTLVKFTGNRAWTPEMLTEVVANTPYFRDLQSKIPGLQIMSAFPGSETITANCIICDNQQLVEKFMSLTGNFNARMDQLTQEERDSIYLVDLFFRKEDDTPTYNDGESGVTMADYTAPFKEKLKLGRAKDVFDYQMFDPTHRRYKVTPSTMYQKKGTKDVSGYTFYSGGAKGSDTAWSEEAEKLGITTKHYTPNDWDNLSDEGKNKLDAEYQEVVSMLGRRVLDKDSYSGKLVRRDMMQADKADAIFAIGTIASNGYVDGGTGYATTRGILRGIPVYLFDQVDSKWKVWDNNSKSFVETSMPRLTPNAATIGTRELKDNGRQAIKDILKTSFTEVTSKTSESNKRRTYTGKITSLSENQVFVFGSNTEGRHGAGAAKVAVDNFGAIYRQAEGPQGKSFAIITKDLTIDDKKNPSRTPEQIKEQIHKLYEYAKQNLDKEFLVAYSKDGKNLNYYSSEAMAEMFASEEIPSNIVFEEGFNELVTANETKPQNTVETKPVETESTNEDGEQKPMTIDEKHHQMSIELKSKLDNLMNSDLLTVTEIRAIAEDIAYFISDTISDLHDNPEKVYENFPDKRTLDENGNWSEENRNRDLNRVRMMTRLELVNFIAPNNLLNLCMKTFNQSMNLQVAKKVRFIKSNWGAFMKLGATIFSTLEKFNIGENTAEAVNDDINSADPNAENNEDEIKELEGNLQEHWQTEFRTQKTVDKMSQMMKQAIRGLLDVDLAGNPKLNEFGRPKRVNFKDAVNSITYWVNGATDLQDMIDKLNEMSHEHPWLKPLITRLSDESGKEYAFQSQFFTVFNLAQQLYSVAENIDGKFSAKPVNLTPALKEATDAISILYRMNIHPLFTNGSVNITKMKELVSLQKELAQVTKVTPENEKAIADKLAQVYNLLGHLVTSEDVAKVLNTRLLNNAVKKLESIITTTRENYNKPSYAPFTYQGDGNISSYVKEMIRPLVKDREATIEKSTYSDGKMHQTFVSHSYMTKLMDKFALKGEKFKEFILKNYDIPWFRNQNAIEFGEGWKNVWLKMLATNEKAREVFQHRVQLNFDKKNYMKNMTETEYLMSALTEYYAESSASGDLVPAWFRIPMMSNKPSSEFLRFYSYRGENYQESIVNGMFQILLQELSRIQTVILRADGVSKDNKIKNFDKNGKKFCFLSFMNKYLEGNVENDGGLGELLRKKINGEKLTPNEEIQLLDLGKNAIHTEMLEYVERVKSSWSATGIIEAAEKSIKGFDADNFIWNDMFAAMNILQLTITDVAFYKDAEDLQKRLAQIHAPGARCNVLARDPYGNRVSDGICRTLILDDFEGLTSNIVENVKVVFQRKIDAAKTEQERKSLEALRDYLVKDPVYDEDGNLVERGAFYDINLTDAQAYNSPTSYRKKAVMFGKWDERAEEIYQELLKNNATYSDIEVAFQPLKPFVYTQKRVDMGVTSGLTTNNVPFQCKNSEYLLVLAGAILQDQDTGRPNLLRVLQQVMEESAKNNPTRGIDTIQFGSAIKSGLSGSINLSQFMEMENGENEAKKYLERLIYQDGTKEYNKTHIHEFPFEDYCLQQEVPAHFKNHEQAHGSQERYIIPSDLESKDADGNTVYYDVNGRPLTREEFKREYEETIALNIRDDINALIDELHINSENIDKKQRNIALSRVLVKEILDNPRYGVDLLYACLVDENGDFVIPLGDPIQSKRVEQLLNSIIKNRINKQTIAGGPVVQVSNFGTSRELNVRFKSKEVDENGKPILLKTRKEFEGTDAQYREYIKKNQGGVAHLEVFAPMYMKEMFEAFTNLDGTIDMEAIEATDPELLKMIGYRIPTGDKCSIAPLKIVGFLPKEAGEGIMMPADITLLNGSDFDVDKMYLMVKKLSIGTKPTNTIFWSMYHALKQGKKYAEREALKEEIGDFLGNIEMMKSTYPELWNTYKKVAYKVNPPKAPKDKRNNHIIDMTYAVLSHEATADKLLNPSNFEVQKKMGYLMEALRTTNKSYEELNAMSVAELKELAIKDKNLACIDVHTQFYKQNAAAGGLIGTCAVHKIAHAVLEGDGFRINVFDACGINDSFEIAGMEFGETMEIDPTKSRDSEFVGKTLGCLVDSSADAVKDPVLNLMNINKNTASVLNVLVRLGMPFEDVAFFLSQKAISDALKAYEKEAVNKSTSLISVINDIMDNLMEAHGINETSEVFTLPITKEALIKGVRESSVEHTLSVLNAFKKLSALATEVKSVTFATRFNSVSSAVGPLVIDNLMLEYKMGNFSEHITDAAGNPVNIDGVFDRHPILREFAATVPLAADLLSDMPAASAAFKSLILSGGDILADKLLGDRKLLNKLSDFYQSYLLITSGVIDGSELSYYVNQFPTEFITSIKTDPRFADNLLIQSVKPLMSKKDNKLHLNIDTSGMTEDSKDPLMSAWTDLFKTDQEIAMKLFKYCFFRGGIGYSPKTFMHLVSVFLKLKIPGYTDTFKKIPSVANDVVMDQFIRNNWDDDKLVPRKKARSNKNKKGISFSFTSSGTLLIDNPKDVKRMSSTPYFKMTMQGKDLIFRMIISTEERLEYVKVQPLGNNKEYLELSTKPIGKPLSTTETCKPSNDASEVQDISKSQEEESITPSEKEISRAYYEKAISIIEQDSRINSREEAESKLQEYRNKSEAAQRAAEEQMKSYIAKKLGSLGIPVTTEEVTKIYDEFTKKEDICK
jgi:hypothetical protein